MKLARSPVLLLLGVLACAALVPAAEGGLLDGLGVDLDLPAGLGGVEVNTTNGTIIVVQLGGETIEVPIPEILDPPEATDPAEAPEPAEAPGPSPYDNRKLLSVAEPVAPMRL